MSGDALAFHGTADTYRRNCRCEPCVLKHNEVVIQASARKRKEAVTKSQHEQARRATLRRGS